MAYVTEEDLASWSIPIANSEYELAERIMELVTATTDDLLEGRVATFDVDLMGSMKNGTALQDRSDFDVAITITEPPATLTRSQELDTDSHQRLSLMNHEIGGGIAGLGGPVDSGFFAHEFEFEGRMVDVVPRTRVAQHAGAVVLFPGGGYGGYVWNWPAEYEQAIERQDRQTNGNFRETIRVAKGIRRKISRIADADPIPSFTLESLLLRVPKSEFRRPLPDRMRAVLADARDQTQADDADQILDPTGRKPLFGSPLVDLEDSYASLVEMLWLLDHDEPFAYLW